MNKTGRYIDIYVKTVKRLLVIALAMIFFCGMAGCSASLEKEDAKEENTDDSIVDIAKLSKKNSDIFAWIRIPDTNIDYPVLQSGEGDDEFYNNHNEAREEDPRGAIHIEAANLKDMCDFNEVLYGKSPSDGTQFSQLNQFLDKSFFDEHPYVYMYMDGNALIYYVFAAYTRKDTKLLGEYDFTYASGCQAFLDEIYEGRNMNKLIRSGWENMVQPENFLITLTTKDSLSGKQLVVIGCLVGDVAGKIDRIVDYGDPE